MGLGTRSRSRLGAKYGSFTGFRRLVLELSYRRGVNYWGVDCVSGGRGRGVAGDRGCDFGGLEPLDCG